MSSSGSKTKSTSSSSKSIKQGDRMSILQAGCEQLNFPLTSLQVDQFERYYHELVEWNKKFNLTAITDYEESQVKHFLDSLVSLPIIAEELQETVPLTTSPTFLDIGTGAGFPGIPIKIASPKISVTLVDGTNKKIRFLEHIVAKLVLQNVQIIQGRAEEIGRQDLEHIVAKLVLQNVQIIQGRAEEIGRQEMHREQYDLVTARAVAPLNTLAEYLLPLTRLNGLAIIFKGGNAAQEFIDARKAIEVLGGEVVRMAPVKVPFLNQERFVILIKKVKRTPERYPRGQGLARKSPIQ